MVGQKNVLLMMGMVGILSSHWAMASNELIPVNNGLFYYTIGGGERVSMPAVNNTTSEPLQASLDYSSGYNCGTFDPSLSISNSLNDLEDSVDNVGETVIENATAAIANFPMYLIDRADPDLYNMLNGELLNANSEFNLSTRSCQDMKDEMAKGQDPYSDWGEVAMGQNWKYQIGTGGDVNQAKESVDDEGGKNGVEWINGDAGGENQTPIYVVGDTTKAGYNAVLNRSANSSDAISSDEADSRLGGYWNTPEEASDWVTSVVGESSIVTYSGGKSDSTPGIGLLKYIQDDTTTITDSLEKLVSGETSVTYDHLAAVSGPGVMINEGVIQGLQMMPSAMQSDAIASLAQSAATNRTLDKAALAMSLLRSGSQNPDIHAVGPAEKEINAAIKTLSSMMQDVETTARLRKELASDVPAHILAYARANQQASLANPSSTAGAAPTMSHGAVMSDTESTQ